MKIPQIMQALFNVKSLVQTDVVIAFGASVNPFTKTTPKTKSIEIRKEKSFIIHHLP